MTIPNPGLARKLLSLIWNTAGRIHLNNQNLNWIWGLASDIPKAKWLVKNVSNDPIRNARHAVMPGISKCEKLLLDKKQIAMVPHKPAADITAPTPYQSKPDLRLKVADWKFWAYTGGSCQVQNGKAVIRAGECHPISDSNNLDELNGAGITNTVGRAELAAIAAALTIIHTLPQTASAHFTNSYHPTAS
eukprot:539256-Pelagomonas_calceolata.AAC.1